MTKHKNKGKPGYRGWYPPKPQSESSFSVTVTASATEISSLSSAQRESFMRGISQIIF